MILKVLLVYERSIVKIIEESANRLLDTGDRVEDEKKKLISFSDKIQIVMSAVVSLEVPKVSV